MAVTNRLKKFMIDQLSRLSVKSAFESSDHSGEGWILGKGVWGARKTQGARKEEGGEWNL